MLIEKPKRITSQKSTPFNVESVVKALSAVFSGDKPNEGVAVSISEDISSSFVARRKEQIADEPEWRPGKGIKVKDLDGGPEKRETKTLTKEAFKPVVRESKLHYRDERLPTSKTKKPSQNRADIIQFNCDF